MVPSLEADLVDCSGQLVSEDHFSAFFIYVPRNIVQISAEGGDDAVQLAQFLRLAIVWGILMIGSMLALVAAAIQLACT
jgi:hypothetical protein